MSNRTGIPEMAAITGIAEAPEMTDVLAQADRGDDARRASRDGETTEWIVLDGHRVINLAHISDIKFVSDCGGVYATIRLSSFDPTTNDREGTSWFNVSGADLERVRACIVRGIAPEFTDQLGAGGPLDGQPRVFDARHAQR